MPDLHARHLLPARIVDAHAPVPTPSRQHAVGAQPFEGEDVAGRRQCAALDPVAGRFGHEVDAVGGAEGDGRGGGRGGGEGGPD